MNLKLFVRAGVLASIALAMIPNASAGKLVSECVDGNEYCVCISDLNASCTDSGTTQNDCRVAVAQQSGYWDGYMCGAIIDLPEGRSDVTPGSLA